MEQQFSGASFIMPCLVFAFGLYLGVVPSEERRRLTIKRTVLCGIGIAYGLFLAISVTAETEGDMNINEAYRYLCGLSLIGWCIYAFLTNHSNLSKWRKFLKVVVYWMVTGCFLSAASPDEGVRTIAIDFGFILPIIAYYTGLIDKDKEETKTKISRKSIKAKVSNLRINNPLKIKRVSGIKPKIANFYSAHSKTIRITFLVIVFLVILPVIIRLLIIYWRYVKDFAGL